ncbi:hypothetical protein [Streptosporangium carneum]|uniref:hypothetical protein n=1 Tax=Streptosporangium carneum TaxID=47481 RepID=UPI0022F2A99B|nr:hypothetical protein [Streptosporangium carneum]
MDIAQLADQIVPYAAAALGAYGTGAIAKIGENTTDGAASIGRRLVIRIFGEKPSEQAQEALDDLSGAPGDPDLRAVLRVQIRKALAADPVLAREVAEMVRSSGVVASGERSVAAHEISGIVVTGDGAQIRKA